MRIQGMPERFWVVVEPSAVSELRDICYACDFQEFALQIRGGLHPESIVGIFADEGEANRVADDLLQRRAEPVVHKSPWPDWYAYQDSVRGVWIYDRASAQNVKVEPPAPWGRNWLWGIREDGSGIEFRRSAER